MRVIFTGDFSASGIFYDKIFSGIPIFDEKIIKIFKDSDFVHVNLENPITSREIEVVNGVGLKAPLQTAHYLKSCYINVSTLANNHIMDCGFAGLKDTMSVLEQNSIKYYGIGGVGKRKEFTILEKNGLRLALVASCTKTGGPTWNGETPGPFSFNIEEVRSIVNKIHMLEEVDYIIYDYHGGTEFNIIPEPNRRKFFHELIDCGVDIIIGHHAHVPQGIEWEENKLIVYGLGNLCFDLAYHKNAAYTSDSYFIEIEFKKDKNYKLKKYFYCIDDNAGIIRLNDNSNTEDFFEQKLQSFTKDKDYYRNWEKEAFRVLFCNKSLKMNNYSHQHNKDVDIININMNLKATDLIIRAKSNLPKAFLFPLILIRNTFANYLDAENMRPLMNGAIMHLIRRAKDARWKKPKQHQPLSKI